MITWNLSQRCYKPTHTPLHAPADAGSCAMSAPLAAISHSCCLEGSLLSGTWKARGVAPGLTSAPATPLRGSKTICSLSPMEKRTGPSPGPALQVLPPGCSPSQQAPGSPCPLPRQVWLLPGAQLWGARPCSPPTPHKAARVPPFPQRPGLVASWGISAPLPSFPRKPWGSSRA